MHTSQSRRKTLCVLSALAAAAALPNGGLAGLGAQVTFSTAS